MKLINPSVTIETDLNGEFILRHVEKAIRNCYKSEDKIGEDSHKKLIKTILDSHHYSTIEHYTITVRVICSRACMAQWTRHRLMSFSIESQRYINYSRGKFGGEITFIRPIEYYDWTVQQQFKFDIAMQDSEKSYMDLLSAGLKAQDARNALNNATKTEMVVSGNLRVWRDLLIKRVDKSAQSEIRYLAKELLSEFKKEIPIIFDDIEV
jgi:thymidylate synthase (FAD)